VKLAVKHRTQRRENVENSVDYHFIGQI